MSYDPLPVLTADPVKPAQALQNLIANSIKFRSERPCEVHISAGRPENAWCFSVPDNGIGFEPESAGQVFDMFRRLHPVGKYAGSGIGLAIAKFIVEGHGGCIWAESTPGQGATFVSPCRLKPSARYRAPRLRREAMTAPS